MKLIDKGTSKKDFQTFCDIWPLTLSWRKPLWYRNQSIDLVLKSMDWFLYDNDLRHEKVKVVGVGEYQANIIWSVWMKIFFFSKIWLLLEQTTNI